MSQRAGEEEGRDCQERQGEHGDYWLEKEGKLEDWGKDALKFNGEIKFATVPQMQDLSKRKLMRQILRRIIYAGEIKRDATTCGN